MPETLYCSSSPARGRRLPWLNVHCNKSRYQDAGWGSECLAESSRYSDLDLAYCAMLKGQISIDALSSGCVCVCRAFVRSKAVLLKSSFYA